MSAGGGAEGGAEGRADDGAFGRGAAGGADSRGELKQTAALASSVISAASRRGVTIACCESLTAGLISARLADVPGASAVLRGGLVVYATELKHTLAGVDAELLRARGAVDPEVATGMAAGAAAVCGADIGIACTGVAGPEPQDGQPVGRVHIGLWWGEASVRTYDFPGERAEIRAAVVDAALGWLAQALDAA